MNGPRSLKIRVALATGVVLVVVLGTTAWIVDHHVRRAGIKSLDDQIEAEAEALANLLRLEGARFVLDADDDLLRTFGAKSDDAFFQIVTPAGIVQRSLSLKDEELPRPDAEDLEPLRDVNRRRVDHDTVDRGPFGEWVRMVTVVVAGGVLRGGDELVRAVMRQPIAVQVARTFERPDKARENVFEALAVALPVALALGVIGAFVAALRSLKPIARMSEEAGSIGQGARTARLEVDKLEGELKELGTTLNAAFDRLEDAVAREQRFSADVAHELRTPLAVLRLRLELALQRERSPEEYQAALRSGLDSCQRVERVANDLLLLAKAEAGPPMTEVVDLRVVVAHVLESVRALETGPPAPIAVALPDTEVPVRGNEALLERMVANLVENAQRHGGKDLEIELTRAGDSAVLRVADRGPGFPAELAGRAFERFARGDASRSRGTGGAGLGLAIVRAIATAHGGSATIGNRAAGGGAEVVVRLAVHASSDPYPS